MTVDQWIQKSGRVFKKARDVEAHLTELAQIAISRGYTFEASTLLLVASRAMPNAEKFVEMLTEQCQKAA